MTPFFCQQFSQREIDLPVLNPGHESSLIYPPVMKLSLSKTCAGASFCYLEVKGVDRELKMALKIISHLEPKLVEAKKLGEKDNLQTSEYKSEIFLEFTSSTLPGIHTYALCTVFP